MYVCPMMAWPTKPESMLVGLAHFGVTSTSLFGERLLSSKSGVGFFGRIRAGGYSKGKL